MAAVIGSGIAFGSTGTAQTLLAKHISPLAVGSTRLFLGAIALHIAAKFMSDENSPKMSRRDWWVSGIGIAVYQLTFFSAVKLTGVPLATLTALGSLPVFTGIVAFLLVREKPARVWFIATVITTIGIILLNAQHSDNGFNAFGVLLALVAGFGFALFTVTSRRALNNGVDSTKLAGSVFALAAVLVLPFAFINGLHWMATAKGATLILWLGLVTTGIAYTLYVWGLKQVPSSTASTLVLAEPATATILAVAVLGNTLPLLSWVGIGVVVVGLLYLAIRG